MGFQRGTYSYRWSRSRRLCETCYDYSDLHIVSVISLENHDIWSIHSQAVEWLWSSKEDWMDAHGTKKTKNKRDTMSHWHAKVTFDRGCGLIRQATPHLDHFSVRGISIATILLRVARLIHRAFALIEIELGWMSMIERMSLFSDEYRRSS